MSLVELFLEAVKIDAQSLRERPMVRFIHNALAGLPVTILEDNIARTISGECGNLICVPPWFDPARPAIALFAHMDTPRSTIGVRPTLTDSRITSDGTTILGVDNRAGSSVLLHVLKQHLMVKNRGNFIVVFTVAEEIGMFGSKHVDLAPYNIRMGFVFDCSRRPGVFIQSAVGCSLYDATFTGKAAHAGVAPENGISAIQIAARAISRIPMGRLSPTMTSNVGMIAGGSATNVVADRCTIHGEVREFVPALIDDHLLFLKAEFEGVALAVAGGVEFESRMDFPPFALSSESEAFITTVQVLQSVGLTPAPIRYLGGSDANMLNDKGIPSVNLGIGAQNPHANDEFILLEDLHKSAEIANALIERCS
ncbi:MAG: M20/M25/M40 family metallo-hydrolase [Bacteroidota bacterium]